MSQKQNLLMPTLLTLLGIVILGSLGYWQLQRMEWKLALLEDLNAEYNKDAALDIIDPSDIDGDFEFRRGTLEGTYDFEKQILVGPRVYKSIPGRHVYTPFRLEDGSYILINRGWVSNEWKDEDEAPWKLAAEQNGSISGLLRNPPQDNPFTPENKPITNQWYTANTAQIAEVKDIPSLHGKVFFLEDLETEGEYPIAMATKPEFANDHFQYALFWFTMAGVLFVIFCLRFLRKQKK